MSIQQSTSHVTLGKLLPCKSLSFLICKLRLIAGQPHRAVVGNKCSQAWHILKGCVELNPGETLTKLHYHLPSHSHHPFLQEGRGLTILISTSLPGESGQHHLA